MQVETLKRALAAASHEGIITCEECLEVASRYDIPKDYIAGILTEMGVRIVQCQLGCFK